MCRMHLINWPRVVDAATIAWLAVFVIGFLAFDADLVGLEPLVAIPGHVEPVWDAINWAIWGVFAVDVFYKYRQSENAKAFLKNHWIDLVLLVPFFRILLLFRIARLLRLIRVLRTLEVVSEFADMYFFGIRDFVKRRKVGRKAKK